MPLIDYTCRDCGDEVRASARPSRCPSCDTPRTMIRSDGYDARDRYEDDGTGDYERAMERRREW